MSQDREYELKFGIAAAATARLKAHPLLQAASVRASVDHLVSTYFDTPEALLHRHRISLRVRRSGSKTTHTLKRASGSRVDRNEWERACDAATPDVAWLQTTPLKPLFAKSYVAKDLGPQFTVHATRTAFPILYGGATIEGALDQGAIQTPSQSLPVNEFELELKSGPARAVLALAQQLASDLPLVLSLSSKAERGYGTIDRSWGHPTKALCLVLADGMTVAQAFEAIVQACLHALLLNAALIGGDEEGEATHKARIALRRLRGAFRLFKPILRRKRFAAIAGEIQWISNTLGDARDADVFQTDVFDVAARDSTVAGAVALAAHMRDLKAQAHARLNEALASRRWRLLLLDLLSFSTEGLRRSTRHKRYRPLVAKRLAQHRRGLARKARNLKALAPEALHAIRKRAKMLRYNLDIVEGVSKLGATGNAFRALQHDLETLQRLLGGIHDADAMREHLIKVVIGNGAPDDMPHRDWTRVAFAAGAIAARPVEQGSIRRAQKAARRVAASKVF